MGKHSMAEKTLILEVMDMETNSSPSSTRTQQSHLGFQPSPRCSNSCLKRAFGLVSLFSIGLLIAVIILVEKLKLAHHPTTDRLPGSSSLSKKAPPVLSITSYNDVYDGQAKDGNLGGAARFFTSIEEWRQQSNRSDNQLILFAGDTLSPSAASTFFHGIQMIELHNIFGIDAACLGNHEFDFGLEKFFEAARNSTFPWLNANCYESSTKKLLRHTQPHLIKEFKNGLKVGIFGVMYNMKEPAKGIYFTDPIKAAQEQVNLLRSQYQVDMVIALTHQGWKDDNQLSSNIHGVDLILGGHDHQAMIQYQFGTPYLKSKSDFFNLWHTDVYPHIGGSRVKKQTPYYFQHELVTIDNQTFAENPAVKSLLEKQQSELSKTTDKVIGRTCADLDLRRSTIFLREAEIGNFMADAQRKLSGMPVDGAVMNAGGIRTDKIFHQTDALRVGDVMSWFPFENAVHIFQITGGILHEYLETHLQHSCGLHGLELSEYLFHPSGFHYAFECYEGQRRGKLTQLTWAKSGRAIDSAEPFLLAINEFMYAQMKQEGIIHDGHFVDTQEHSHDLSDILIRMIEHHDGHLCPTIDHRFTLEWKSSR